MTTVHTKVYETRPSSRVVREAALGRRRGWAFTHHQKASQTQRASPSERSPGQPALTSTTKPIAVRPTAPLRTAFTSRMVRNRGADLLEDSTTRASPDEPQEVRLRPLAPCFTVRSPDRDMPHATRHLSPVRALQIPDFPGGSLIDYALEGLGVPCERIRRKRGLGNS